MREGMGRRQAALASSRQLLTPIIGMTITLAAVYVPVGFLSGLTGVMVKEFAFTLAVAVLISGLVALTLSPIMSAYFCPPQGEEGRMTTWVNMRFDLLRQHYERLLARSLQWTPQILGFGLFFSALAIPFLMMSQQELAPIEDESSISVIADAPPEASLAYTHQHMHDIVEVMSTLPGATYMWQVLSPNGAFGGQGLVDAQQRDDTPMDLLQSAFGKLAQIPGLRAFPTLFPPYPVPDSFRLNW